MKYKDNAGTVRYTSDGTNIGETKQCNIPAGVNISQVQLKISYKSVAKNFNINVLEGPLPKQRGELFYVFHDNMMIVAILVIRLAGKLCFLGLGVSKNSASRSTKQCY